jgi:hypothetical protein
MNTDSTTGARRDTEMKAMTTDKQILNAVVVERFEEVGAQ